MSEPSFLEQLYQLAEQSTAIDQQIQQLILSELVKGPRHEACYHLGVYKQSPQEALRNSEREVTVKLLDIYASDSRTISTRR